MPTQIDEKKCSGCGECVEICPVSPCVYELKTVKNKVKSIVKNPSSCIDCGACIINCSEGAISKQN